MTTAPTRTRMLTYLDGSGHTAAEVGGKGAGLDRLIGWDYPVPPAAVVTTAAFRTTAAERSIRLLIDDVRNSHLPPPDRIAAENAAIERTFLTAPLPEPVATAIARAGAEMLRRGPVAVRSSATAEDLSDASFAGQYLTVTGVAGIRDLERAVRRCWASLWMPAARAYRRRQRIPEHDLAMAVVIQGMVEPLWSGVAFSADPQGRGHLIRIEAVPGLGEALVSGKATPADYLVRKDTLEIAAADGSADLHFLEDLARLVLRIEQSERSPQDVEWAYTASGITLLQVRPITEPALITSEDDGFDTPKQVDATYTPHGVIEMLPNVVPPLLWSINSPMLEDAFRTTFAALGAMTPDKNRPIVSRFRGRAALDLSVICGIAESLPGGNPAEVERQYLGRTISEEPPTTTRGVHMLAAIRSRQVHNRIVDEVELIATAAEALAGMQIELSDLPARRLVAYRQRIRDLAWRGYAAEVGASSAAGATYRALEMLLERWLPEPLAASWAQRTTRGALASSAVGAARSKNLESVLTSHGTPAIRELIRTNDQPREEITALGLDGRSFLANLDNVVRVMGSTSVYGGPTWAEDDWWIWRQLQYLVDQTSVPRSDPEPDDFAELCRYLAGDKRWRRLRFLTGQVIDLRVRWLLRQLGETVRFLEQRERAKSALLVLGGEERRLILEASRRLVESRQLPELDLALYLTDSELEAMLFGQCGIDAGELTRRRAVAMVNAGRDPLPDWFDGEPSARPASDGPPATRLEGWAAGPGHATGPVRIINSLAEGTRLEQGDVLVAHSTDPSWTPLFLIAGAIVLETGGPLSHAAIVAREFGLPAVLNIPHVTKLLGEGETVLVDGTLGSVVRTKQEGVR